MPSSPGTSAAVTLSGPDPPAQGYDGTSPFPPDGPAPAHDGGERLYVTVTTAIVFLPFVAIGLAGRLLWGRLVRPVDIVLTVVLCTIIATHRRHHAFPGRPGDPHSPYRYGAHLRGQLHGLPHAHIGPLFHNDRTPPERYSPDLIADRDIRAIDRAFPALCGLTLALPLAGVRAIGGTWPYGATTFLRAGLVRFALLAFGESRRSLHHADPTSTRHGVDHGRLDPSAAVIRFLERLGRVHDVRRPIAERPAARRP
ncbi:acyl-CoA desaturase [Streptomyces aureus]|uniref:acyl-CoA desaturase n=1 Tax=Streptomyces aureus TaxID=193461 RepID=UPI00367C2619